MRTVQPVLFVPPAPGATLPWLRHEWPTLAGLAALYLPTFATLARDAWQQPDHWHEPAILAVCLYLLWVKRAWWLHAVPADGAVRGWWPIGAGLALYALGRSQGIVSLEMASLMPVLAGLVWCRRGAGALRAVTFPIGYLAFAVPLPFFFIDWLSGGLKATVSQIVSELLYRAGYPIAHQGVVLSIGPYQMLVADACSGMNSLYSLAALGLLYLHLRDYSGSAQRALLLASLVPIAVAANVFRVLLLVLLTYYFGETAAQGAMHPLLGFGTFAFALALLIGVDRLTGLLWRRHG